MYSLHKVKFYTYVVTITRMGHHETNLFTNMPNALAYLY